MESELDFNETLTKMAELAKQMELLNMIRAILKFIRANQNLYFGDLLQALARYAAMEYAKEEGSNPDWDVIGSLLRQAASKVDSGCDYCQVRSISLEIEIEEQFTKYSRHSLLLNMVTVWARCLERERYRFADILRILSEYALGEAQDMEENKISWELAGSIIYSAYEKAQAGNIP